MTPAQARNEVERLITTLFGIGVAIDSSPVLNLTSHGETIVTWSNNMSLSELFGQTSTLQEYITTLDNRWYSVVLSDGALLQFSYTFKGNTLKKHRLSYHPCPIFFQPLELQHYTIAELLQLFDGRELRDRLRIEGAIRFDYDIDSGTLDHPPSHLTISRLTSRIPVFAPLSLGHFVRFTFAHFYPEQWQACEELRKWSCSAFDTCLPDVEHERLFIQWKRA